MDRREILTASATVALGLVVLPVPATAQAKSAKEKIVGAWSLVSIYDEAPDGKKYEPWGPGVQGFLIYTAGGRVSSQVISADRDKAASKNPRMPVGQAIAYFGSYSVDEATMTITSRIERCTFPAWDGIVRVSKIASLSDDELEVESATVHDPVNGDIVPRVHYKRAS
jgi:Lipocalin-like domain